MPDVCKLAKKELQILEHEKKAIHKHYSEIDAEITQEIHSLNRLEGHLLVIEECIGSLELYVGMIGKGKSVDLDAFEIKIDELECAFNHVKPIYDKAVEENMQNSQLLSHLRGILVSVPKRLEQTRMLLKQETATEETT